MANGWVSSSQVNQVTSKKMVILSRLKTSSSQSGYKSGQVVFFPWFFFLKKNNMYFSFGKSCNKLFDIKCITLNSSFISRMNSVKFINTYSIILKLYKSQHNYLKQNNTTISKTNTQILFLHNIKITKYKTKLQIIYWITHLTKNKNI